MSSNDPCAVYNFYNCCDPSAASGSSGVCPFIWQAGAILDPEPISGTPTDTLRPVFNLGNSPDTDLKAYQGLTPLHRKARLLEISLIKFPPIGVAYTSTIAFNLVVLDYNGVVIRTISTASINFQTLALRTWTPVSLSTTAGDLDIPAGQLIAGELIFGAPQTIAFSSSFPYQLTGTGTLF